MKGLISLIAYFAAIASLGVGSVHAGGGEVAAPWQQVAQSRPGPWTGRGIRKKRPQAGPHGGLQIRPFCIPGFRVYRTPDQNRPANQYICTSYIAFTCAPPYAFDFHGLLHMGGDGDFWPYYRCKRARPATHVGANLCAVGFRKSGAPPNPATQISYVCRGAEPQCAPGYQYRSFKKIAKGWRYICRR